MKIAFAFLVLASLALAQSKPCIAFHSTESDVDTARASREALETAVTLSGDFNFYSAIHDGCWTVDELSFATTGVKGYVISYVVINPMQRFIYHGVATGPDEEAFERAMRTAAVQAIKDIRAVKSP